MSNAPQFGSNEPPSTLTEAAGLGTGPVPMEPYRSPAFHEKEREQVFKRSWLMMCRQEEVPKPGDFVLRNVEICRASIIIARGSDGQIRAFHNVCSHRGNQVVVTPSGSASRFMCRYHNWTYRNDGQLLAIPDEASFFNVDKKRCGLTPIATEIWEGWVFINLTPDPEVGLKEFLGGMGEYLQGYPYLAVEHPVTFEAMLDCNWKVVSDAFSESYHIPAIHAQTLGSTFASKPNPFAHLLSARVFGPHRMTSMFGNSGYTPNKDARVEQLGQNVVTTGNAISAVSTDAVAGFLSHPAVNPTKTKDWSMDINHIFPNTQIDSGRGGFFTHQYWPLSYNRTRHVAKFYIIPPTNALERFRVEQYIARVCEVLLEDLTNVERTQRGLESGAKDFMQLQDNEIMIRHSIEQTEKWVQSSSVKEALGLN